MRVVINKKGFAMEACYKSLLSSLEMIKSSSFVLIKKKKIKSMVNLRRRWQIGGDGDFGKQKIRLNEEIERVKKELLIYVCFIVNN